jgi:hypothetical protein
VTVLMEAPPEAPEAAAKPPQAPPWECPACGFVGRKQRATRPRPSRERVKICPACLTEAK